MLKTYFQAVGLLYSLIFQKTASFPHLKWRPLWCEFFPHQRQTILTCFSHSSRCLIFVLLYFCCCRTVQSPLLCTVPVNLNTGIDLCRHHHHHHCDTALAPQPPPRALLSQSHPAPVPNPGSHWAILCRYTFEKATWMESHSMTFWNFSAFSLLPVRRSQVVARINNSWSFHRREVFRSIGYSALFTRGLAVGYLGCLQFWVIVNQTALNFHFI